jgi:hypothetical protein
MKLRREQMVAEHCSECGYFHVLLDTEDGQFRLDRPDAFATRARAEEMISRLDGTTLIEEQWT